ncbi:LuxR C-terminal-related transcriptional regulator [Chitinophaga sancti]|uniref:LuxR C-terminal-related transcriptional regulator n=1 Tax=Chitinophaga sancti TaxID=1004 RepID=A0A1K1NUX2_9BACT|nr:LuxR C-terminal-related transcriptional regulator [Chitinophaga sancti]WQD60199.1 LuxR C-terminal-related transcriptional regulator [Chitinophaga sancti]WQG87673.1 LuxR C-terminal-related transcriptional regulator [Chitinophaga sancti]SFW39111.1 regulatory protein, luxR family [Chitinophaga sancti]
MKNKYLKGAHLSERKFKEILRLFAEDLTATQIASISGVSRVTVNSYLKKIRQQIARHCESLLPTDPLRSTTNERKAVPATQDSDSPLPVKTGVSRNIKPVVFGIYRASDRLHTEILPDVSRSMIHSVVRSNRSILETQSAADKIRRFSNVADLGQYRLYNLENEGTSNGSDDVDAFWGLTKHRLAKFKGLNRSTVYLHLKECEFRYNNRNEDIYETLLELLKTQPLSLS